MRAVASAFFSRSGFGILNTVGRAISNSGLITGTNSYADPGGPSTGRLFARGFVYDPGTDTFFDATPPNATGFVIMQGMNRSGVIAGGGNQANLGAVALVWQMGLFADGKGTVPFLSRIQIGSQVFFARARGITDDGTITGFTLDSGVVYGAF